MQTRETKSTLRQLLRKRFALQFRGADIKRHARAQGLADGYMRALLDLSLISDAELLEIIDAERRSEATKAQDSQLASSPAEAFA